MLTIQRHKTAIRRIEISRPIRLALDHELLSQITTFFDYGCGHGDDVVHLNQRGISATGWDPIHNPTGARRSADVVNLGYVVNVIEDLHERIGVLKDAWSLAQRLLIVSARLSIEAKNEVSSTPYADGCVTARGTFQKYYDQRELGDWIKSVLGVQGSAVAPGVFYVFRDNELRQSFDASRYRRALVIPRQKCRDLAFEKNRKLFDPLLAFITNRGRLPDDSEIEIAPTIRKQIGSFKRAFSIIRQVTGDEHWTRIREERSQDLLVYLGLCRFSGRPRFSELSNDLKLDVRAFFGNYQRACDLADTLLFSAGSREVIREACQNSRVGKQLPEALYVHSSAVASLSSVLRVYEGCARAYIGAVEGANVVKLSITKPQISYLHYPNFEREAHPCLIGSLVVPLNSFRIKYNDYTHSKNPFILHRKETLLQPEHPLQEKFRRLTRQEERYGLYDQPGSISTKEGWQLALRSKGLVQRGHRLVRNERKGKTTTE